MIGCRGGSVTTPDASGQMQYCPGQTAARWICRLFNAGLYSRLHNSGGSWGLSLAFRQLLYFSVWYLAFAFQANASKPARYALLIGNKSYAKAVGPLVNPHNDIELVGQSLKKLGFQITVVKDGNYQQMDVAFKRHVHRVRRGGKGAISFIYYSGHGVANPETKINYIIPVNVTEANDDLWFNAFEQQAIVDRLKRHVPNAIHYVVFDACRNELNITGTASKSLGTNKGFMPIANSAGILVAYATAPGKTASDKGSGGGEYAKVLAQELLRPGVEAVTMFRRVQLRVANAINQEPWLNYGTLPEIYLAGRERPEVVAWEAIKDSNDVARFKTYLADFPSSPFSDSARFKIRILENERRNKAAAAGWKRIETSSEPSVLKAYIAKFPDHPYANFARFRIDELRKQAVQRKRQADWDVVKDARNPAVLRRFISRHRGSLFAKMAEDRIALLDQRRRDVATKFERAAQAWQKIQDLDGTEPVKDFLAEFGDTPFRSLAETRLNEIEQRQAEEVEALKRRQQAAEEAKRQRLAALDSERKRREAEAEAARMRQALAENKERLVALEAERKRLAAAEAERRRSAARDARKREAEKEAERQRLAALERQRKQLEAEAEAERKREALAKKQERLAALETERKRLEAAETERRNKAEETERQRRRAEEAERQRMAALERERERLEAEAAAAQEREAEAAKQRRLAALESARKQAAARDAERLQKEREEQAEITLKDLTKSLQVALSRVGCSPGSIDGVWGSKSRRAVDLFNKHAGEKLDSLSPTLVALETIRKRNKRVCPKADVKKQTKDGRNTKSARRESTGRTCQQYQACRRRFIVNLMSTSTTAQTFIDTKADNACRPRPRGC